MLATATPATPATRTATAAAHGFALHASDRSPALQPSRAPWHLLAATLDELDYGVVLLGDGARVLHLNDAAAVELDDERHPLQRIDGELVARSSRDAAALHDAVDDAARRGLRRLLTLGSDAAGASVSVVPLAGADTGPRAVLLVLGKRTVCESLSVQGFARSHGLTGAETRVLVALCNGVPPAEIAVALGVAISTIRSQIGSMRAKTGAGSIRALVGQVAVLPPVKGALRRHGNAARATWPSAPMSTSAVPCAMV